MFARHTSPDYVSEFTTFMQDFMQTHPDVIADQRRGWNIHWDHRVDFDELERAGHDSLPQKANENFTPVEPAKARHQTRST